MSCAVSKHNMRDTQLQQPPLCLLPADRLDSIQTFSLRRVGPSITAGEMECFKYFANVIDDRRYGYHRAAAAAGPRSLVQRCLVPGPLGPEVDMATPWLLNVNPDRAPLVYPDRNPFFSHLPHEGTSSETIARETSHLAAAVFRNGGSRFLSGTVSGTFFTCCI